MKQPGWRSPVISFIPHYGSEASIQAIQDFLRIRPLVAEDSYFGRFLTQRVGIRAFPF